MNIVYFAVQDVTYPRNRLIRERLSDAGHVVEVLEVPVSGSYLSRSAQLRKRYKELVAKLDVIDVLILAEFAAQYAPIAYLMSKLSKAVFVHDYFVGLVETNIGDWSTIPKYSPRAVLHRMVDRLAVAAPDLVLRDTEPRAAAIERYARGVVQVLPVECPSWVKYLDIEPPETLPRVLFYGNYIPLHGVATILNAFDNTASSLTVIGSGQGRAELESLHANVNIVFLDSVGEDELQSYIRSAHIVLGIFGDSEKASSVIPNKVWQALGCGRMVITRTSPAYDSIIHLLPPGQLILVPPADSLALHRATLDAVESGAYLDSFPSSESVVRSYFNDKWDEFAEELLARTKKRCSS